MARPLLLDLFCGEGGCSVGYHRAGFDVVGVDKEPSKGRRYPYEFVQGDALEFFKENHHLFDVVHASPPCKSENPLRHLRPDIEHPDLLTPTIEVFASLDKPWVIENVAATRKLPGAALMCGAAFGLGAVDDDGIRRVLRRHRLFSSNVFLMTPGCACNDQVKMGVYGHGGARPKPDKPRSYQANKAEAVEAMAIDWMSREGLSQAIPPAYTEFIGEQLLHALAESWA